MTSKARRKALKKASGGKHTDLLKIPGRYPGGQIRHEDRAPVEYHRAPDYVRELREYLTGDPHARCDWHDPLEHFRHSLSKHEFEAAGTYRALGTLLLKEDEANDWPSSDVLGRLQARGAIPIGSDAREGMDIAWERFNEATGAMRTQHQRAACYRVCVLKTPQFTHGPTIDAAHTYWKLFCEHEKLHLKNGLACLVDLWKIDRTAKSGVWFAPESVA